MITSNCLNLGLVLAQKKRGDNLESRAIEQVKVLKRSPLFYKHVADGSLKIAGAPPQLANRRSRAARRPKLNPAKRIAVPGFQQYFALILARRRFVERGRDLNRLANWAGVRSE